MMQVWITARIVDTTPGGAGGLENDMNTFLKQHGNDEIDFVQLSDGLRCTRRRIFLPWNLKKSRNADATQLRQWRSTIVVGRFLSSQQIARFQLMPRLLTPLMLLSLLAVLCIVLPGEADLNATLASQFKDL